MARFIFDLEDIDRNSGLTIEDASVVTSTSVFTGADYNGDGIDDLVVAPTTESSTQLQIVYGGDELPANIDLEDLEETTRLEGNSNGALDFVLLANSLDFNGDDIEDLTYFAIEGTTFDDLDFASRLIFGSEDLPANIDLSDLDGDNGLELTGENSIVISQGINVNNDDNDDLVFAVENLESLEPTLSNYIFFGDDRDFNSTLDPTAVNGRNGFEIEADGSSLSIAAAEDINDDGFNDLIINSFGVDGTQNASSILFGDETFPATVDLQDLDGDDGFNIVSSDADEDEIISAFALGDNNGDEIADLLISQATLEELEPGEELDPDILSNPNNSGLVSGQKIFAVFGNETFDETVDEVNASPVLLARGTVDLDDLDGDNGYAIVNSDADELNITSTNTLDLNNDELQDLVINDIDSDRTYVVFGQSEFEAEIDLADLDGDNGFAISEAASFQYTNSYTGDINDDGIDDLILETDIDRTYVVFGTESDFGAEFDPTGDTNTLAILTQSADIAIRDIIDLNDDGADDLVYESGSPIDSLLGLDTADDFTDIQVVYGDADLGIAD